MALLATLQLYVIGCSRINSAITCRFSIVDAYFRQEVDASNGLYRSTVWIREDPVEQRVFPTREDVRESEGIVGRSDVADLS